MKDAWNGSFAGMVQLTAIAVAVLQCGCNENNSPGTDATATPAQLPQQSVENAPRTEHDLTTAQLCKLYNLPLPTDSNGNPIELWGTNKGQRISDSELNNSTQSKPHLSQEDRAYLIKQGLDPDKAELAGQAPKEPPISGMVFLDDFMGESNFSLPSDSIISMKPHSLKVKVADQLYDYSGHYCIMLNTPRKHFSFGSPKRAKFLSIANFGGDSIVLQDAKIWDTSDSYIDAEAMGKEWICYGSFTVQD